MVCECTFLKVRKGLVPSFSYEEEQLMVREKHGWSIMNCRACLGRLLGSKQYYKPFIVVEPNSNVLWVTCSTSHKHESCTLRFHIRT